MLPAQNVRKDFVSGVLSEEELGQQLHIHELHRDYAACVLNLRSYDAISRDVLQVRSLAVMLSLLPSDVIELICASIP